MLVAVQVFSPQKPPLKFIYGAVGNQQMSVLETLFDHVGEKRRRTLQEEELEGLAGEARGSGRAEEPRLSGLSGTAGGGRTDEEMEEEERRNTQLLLETIDRK